MQIAASSIIIFRQNALTVRQVHTRTRVCSITFEADVEAANTNMYTNMPEISERKWNNALERKRTYFRIHEVIIARARASGVLADFVVIQFDVLWSWSDRQPTRSSRVYNYVLV